MIDWDLLKDYLRDDVQLLTRDREGHHQDKWCGWNVRDWWASSEDGVFGTQPSSRGVIVDAIGSDVPTAKQAKILAMLPEWGVLDLVEEKVVIGPTGSSDVGDAELEPVAVEGFLTEIAEPGCFYRLLRKSGNWMTKPGAILVVSGNGGIVIDLSPDGGYNDITFCDDTYVRKVQSAKDLE